MATTTASSPHHTGLAAADTATGDRDSYLDLWRSAALVRVVVIIACAIPFRA